VSPDHAPRTSPVIQPDPGRAAPTEVIRPEVASRGLLVVIESRGEERQVVFPVGRSYVGFGAEQQLIVSTRPVSWPVCSIQGGPGGFVVVEGAPGLRLGGRPLEVPHRLAPGDRLELGRVALKVPAAASSPDLEAQITRAARSSKRNLGRYVLLAELGHGSFSAVHKAWDLVDKKLVAVKVLVQLAPEIRERFKREGLIAPRLKHPSIVPIIDRGEHEHRPFLVMPIVEGRTLEQIVSEEGPLDLRVGVTLLRDVARAIQHAHECNVLHRDLKPGNVIVDQSDKAFVLDFGLARYIRDQGPRLTTTGAFVGTPLFLAPEQALGEGDARADVYGLGALLYYVLTGRPPLDASSLDRYLDQLQKKRSDPPSVHRAEVPPDLDAVTLRSVERDPEERYPSAASVAEDLDRWLRGDPVATPPAPKSSLERVIARHWFAIGLTLLGVIVALSLAIAATVLSRR